MSPNKITPPQKHLATYIFNETESASREDEQRLDTFDPQRNGAPSQKLGKGYRYDVVVSGESQDFERRSNPHRPVSFSGASNLRESTTKSNYVQSSTGSMRDPVDEAYRRQIGVQDTENTEEVRESIQERQQEDEEDHDNEHEGENEDENEEHYQHHHGHHHGHYQGHHYEGENEEEEEDDEPQNNSNFDHQRHYQMMYGGSLHGYPVEDHHNTSAQESALFYGNKLDQYLRSQEKTQSSFVFERPTAGYERAERIERDPNDHYFYHMDDGKRRLKVPSIRYFEDGHVSPMKQRLVEEKYKEIRDRENSVEKQAPHEEREVLAQQDQNLGLTFQKNRLAATTQALPPKQKHQTPKKGLNQTNKSLKSQKSVKSIPNKRSTKENLENVRNHGNRKDSGVNKSKERKSGTGERGRPQTSVPPRRKIEEVKIRPLSRSPHPSHANKTLKKDTHHHNEEPEK